MIPLRDASRTPVRFPVVTVSLIALNVLAFLWEVGSDEAAIIRWAVVPTELMRGQLFRHSALTTRHRDAHRTPDFISSPGLDPRRSSASPTH